MCVTSFKLIETRLKKSIKWFLGLSRNTPDELVSTLVKVDFRQWAHIEAERARIKWENRKEVDVLPKYVIEWNVKWLPKELAKFINLQNVFCRTCSSRLSSAHYLKHGVWVPDLKNLLKEIEIGLSSRCLFENMELTREASLDAAAQLVMLIMKRC